MLNKYLYMIIDTALLTIFIQVTLNYFYTKILQTRSKEENKLVLVAIAIVTVGIVVTLNHYKESIQTAYAVWYILMLISYVWALMSFVKVTLDYKSMQNDLDTLEANNTQMTVQLVSCQHALNQAKVTAEENEALIKKNEELQEKLLEKSIQVDMLFSMFGKSSKREEK